MGPSMTVPIIIDVSSQVWNCCALPLGLVLGPIPFALHILLVLLVSSLLSPSVIISIIYTDNSLQLSFFPSDISCSMDSLRLAIHKLSDSTDANILSLNPTKTNSFLLTFLNDDIIIIYYYKKMYKVPICDNTSERQLTFLIFHLKWLFTLPYHT